MLEDQLAEEDGSEDDNNDKEFEIVSPINTSHVDQRKYYHSPIYPLAVLRKSLDRAMFLHNSSQEVRLSGIRVAFQHPWLNAPVCSTPVISPVKK